MEKSTLIVGDLNYCNMSENNDISKFLNKYNFKELVEEATHIEGNQLDHAHWMQVGNCPVPEVELYATYFTDHDAIKILIPDPIPLNPL